jgi:hypothetical protein
MLLALLALTVSPTGPCTGPDTRTLTEQAWLSGDYTAFPVIADHQQQMMKRLGRHLIQRITGAEARAIIGDASLPRANYYYLAQVGYLGAWDSDFKPTNRDPEGISLQIKVAPGGVAYVTSSLLSRDNGVGTFAVVLASPTPLTRVVSTCFAAA